MKELVEKVKQLAQQELENSYKKFPKFNSGHEGYAVLLEEFEEAKEEIEEIEEAMKDLWVNVKNNLYNKNLLDALVCLASKSAAELIQTASMAQKFIDSMEKPKVKPIEVRVNFMIHVSRDQATQIIKGKGPKGLFYTINDGLYLGIDNRSGETLLKEFTNRQECFDWLESEVKQ